MSNPTAQPGTVHEEVVSDAHNAPHRVIAIAVDSSEYSQHAFNWALDNIIRPETDEVVLLNVRPHVVLPMIVGVPVLDIGNDFARIEEHNKDYSHKLLKSYAEGLLKKNIKCRGVALRGDAREELVFKTDQLKPSMFVIGSRGLGAIKRAFLGSVSDYCVHHCKCPVIVPRPVEN